VLSTPLFVRDVSHQFLDIVRDNLEIVVIASPRSIKQNMSWSIQFIDPYRLEDQYVKLMMGELNNNKNKTKQNPIRREKQLRTRFRNYLQKFQLHHPNTKQLRLECRMKGNNIVIADVSEEQQS